MPLSVGSTILLIQRLQYSLHQHHWPLYHCVSLRLPLAHQRTLPRHCRSLSVGSAVVSVQRPAWVGGLRSCAHGCLWALGRGDLLLELRCQLHSLATVRHWELVVDPARCEAEWALPRQRYGGHRGRLPTARQGHSVLHALHGKLDNPNCVLFVVMCHQLLRLDGCFASYFMSSAHC
jgi:hypothetical protein